MVIWGNGVPTKSAKTFGTFEISKRGVISLSVIDMTESVHARGHTDYTKNIIVSVRK